jgi:hypothetical protein
MVIDASLVFLNAPQKQKGYLSRRLYKQPVQTTRQLCHLRMRRFRHLRDCQTGIMGRFNLLASSSVKQSEAGSP